MANDTYLNTSRSYHCQLCDCLLFLVSMNNELYLHHGVQMPCRNTGKYYEPPIEKLTEVTP